MKKINLLSFLLSILFLIVLSLFIDNEEYTNEKELELTEGRLESQANIEEEFETEGYTLDNPNVILNPYGNSPLTAIVLFETEEEGITQVTVEGKDAFTEIIGYGEKGKKHYVPVYGLYADKENKVKLKFNGKEKEIKIKTEPLSEEVVLPLNVKNNKEKLVSDFYFFTPANKGLPTAYDVNGDVRWYLTDYLTWDISTLENGRLLLGSDRELHPPYYNTGLYEIDFLGKVYNEYVLPGGYHHDFYELENGNLLIASNDFSNYEEGTVEDYIVEIDRDTGDVVKEWDLKEVLPIEDGKSENWTNYDWFHNNSVWYDEEENSIILSGRHQDAVVSIDYDTGELNWILGDSTGWSEEYQKYFFTPVGDEEFEWQWSQHSAKITPEGNVFLLDNGNNKSKIKEEYVPAEESYTRGVIYDIDTDNMTIEQKWQYGKERGSEFYSPYISDVDYLDKNHYIVHSGGIVYVNGEISNNPAGFDKNPDLYSTTVELLDDEVVFELTLPTNMYRSEKMDIYKKYTFELGDGGYLGSLGETKVSREYKGHPDNSLLEDEEYSNYNIELTNEKDRLVVNGHYKKGSDIELILYKEGNIKEYDIRVSEKPYTALCVVMFVQEKTDNTLEVTKHINKEGLSGKHSIYIRIDGKLYNTSYIVDFN